jgi:hypothetical protein
MFKGDPELEANFARPKIEWAITLISTCLHGELSMSILQSLKTVSASRPNHQPALLARRHKLIERIHQQILAAEAKQRGQHAIQTVRRRIKNSETGAVIEQEIERRIQEHFWCDHEGHVFLELRYGARRLEFAKGKTAIDVGGWNDLIPTLEKLKQATGLGELDEQLTSVAGRLQQQLAAKKAQKK